MEEKESRSIILPLCVVVIFIVIFIIFMNLLVKIRKQGSNLADNNVNNIEVANIKTNEWELYKNDEYKFSAVLPKGLYKAEFKNQGGYEYFIEFNKTNETKADGVHIGVSKKSLNEEVDGVIASIKKQSQVEPTNTQEININNLKGIRLDYQNEGLEEKRSIIFIKSNDYVYSISTTPGQIDKVMEGFSLN